MKIYPTGDYLQNWFHEIITKIVQKKKWYNSILFSISHVI